MSRTSAPSDRVVLIVDDDKPIADYVAAVVADAGYTAVVATRGAEALELARSRWPVLLITDLMLPFMGGSTLIAALRAPSLSALASAMVRTRWRVRPNGRRKDTACG